MSAAFYTIYHAFLALLAQRGYESRNQECTLALLTFWKENDTIAISKESIEALQHAEHTATLESENIIGLREHFQYGTETSIDDHRLEQLTRQCRQAIEEAKEELYRHE